MLFAFGVARVPAGEALPGPVLLRLLADLGLSEPAARAVILRMRREGWLRSVRRGRRADYELAPAVLAMEQRYERQLRGPRAAWEGRFHGLLYEVPERHRSFRDSLRRFAHLAGYATLRPGLLIALGDRSTELAPMLERTPKDCQILHVRLELPAPDARRLAVELWSLDALAESYQTLIRSTTAAAERAQREAPAGPDALREFAATVGPVFEAAAQDPGVPDDLLPDDWPGAQLSAALGQALRAFEPLLSPYLQDIRRGPARRKDTTQRSTTNK